MARRHFTKMLAASLGAASAAACSPTDLVNALVPRTGYTVMRDLAYAEGPRQRLDFYLPDSVRPGTPLVVFFYGGRWQTGRKEHFLFVAEAFVSAGFAVAIPDTRLYPEVRYPVFVEDAAAAVAWSVHASMRHGLPEGGPMVLAGHLSGAYVAAMLALDDRWLATAGAPRCAGLLGLAGPYDFLPLHDADLRDLFHADRYPSHLAETQPIAHAGPGDPPALLLTGAADVTVRPGNSHRLAKRLRGGRVRAEVVEYPGLGHLGIIAALAAPLRANSAPVLRDAARFAAGLAVGSRSIVGIQSDWPS